MSNERLITTQEKERILFVRNSFIKEARAKGLSGRALLRWVERKLRRWAKVEFKQEKR